MVEGIDAWFKGEAPRNWPNHPHTVPSSLCNGFAVIAGGASRLRRASEDAGERWMWPSFEARKSAHLRMTSVFVARLTEPSPAQAAKSVQSRRRSPDAAQHEMLRC